jgi:hypothetical protein
VVTKAFRERGHEAFSCDIDPTEGNPKWHFQKDLMNVLDYGWDMAIFHPPCTYLANSGVQHLHKDKSRWVKMNEARDFFLKLYNSEIPRICIENPVPHRYARLPDYTQIIQPYYFGENAQKKTCLWLKNLPVLTPTNIVDKGEVYIGKNGKSNGSKWYQLAPSKNRGKERARTFKGIAEAMASQWGSTNKYEIQSSLECFTMP